MNESKTTVVGRYVGGSLFDTNDDGKYTACVVLNDGEDQKIKAIRNAAVTEKWGEKKPKALTDWTLREGDDEEYEASFGRKFINPKANAKNQPKTVKKIDGVLEAVGDETIYPGCYVAVSVNAYGMDANKEKNMKACVCLGLGNVMFLKDGERLGGGSNPEDDFADFATEASNDIDDDLDDFFDAA